MEIKNRIRYLRKDMGLSQTEFGKIAGVSKGAVSQWESGTTKPDRDAVHLLVTKRQVNPTWLLNGIGEPYTKHDKGYKNTKPSLQSSRTILVISMVQAGNPQEVIDSHELGAGFDEINIDENLSSTLGPYAFALVISGDSMYCPTSPDSFTDGDIVVIDPDVSPLPGDFVVAKLDNEDTATFKKYRSRGTDGNGNPTFELVPLNQDYPTLVIDSQNPGHVVGTMIEHRRFRRRR